MLQAKTASDFMVSKLVTLSPNQHVFEGISQLLKHNISGAPVVDSFGKYLGVFSEKCCMNVLGALAKEAHQTGDSPETPALARDIMTQQLVTLDPQTNVYDAIETLLKHRISGAPVIDDAGNFLGVFSEKTSMKVLLSAAYDQLPTSNVESVMDSNMDRVIPENTNLFDVAQRFLDTPLRRLVVAKDGQLLGQISRRDVLKTEQQLSGAARHRIGALAKNIVNGSVETNSESETESDSTNANSASHTLSFFMDRNAKTIPGDVDLLEIARLFLNTTYRRLPVIDNEILVGQVSRRDLLTATRDVIVGDGPQKEKTLLYLSSLVERQNAPIE